MGPAAMPQTFSNGHVEEPPGPRLDELPKAARASTIAEFIRAVGDAHEGRTALVGPSEALSYRDLERRSADLARGLLARGVGKGCRFGLMLGNCPQWAVWWAAASRAGATVVPLSTFMRPAELARVIRHADLHALVMTPALLSQNFVAHLEMAYPTLVGSSPELALEDAPFLRWIVCLDDTPPVWAHGVDWVLRAGTAPVWDTIRDRAEAEIHPEDEALIIYTSGQSAAPKGVVHSHGGVTAKIHYLREKLCFDENSREPATLPFFWVGGLVMVLLTVMEAGGVVECVEKSSYRSGPIIGAQSETRGSKADLPMAPALGMTETFGMYSWGKVWRAPDRPMCAPVDELEPGLELKLLTQDGKIAKDGERGEICLRGPTVMVRLQKVARSFAFDPDGFHHTGDEAQVEGERFHFLGRLGDLIKTSGASVAPAEVERELVGLSEVQSAHVVGLDDAKRGQLVAAAVILTQPGATTAAAIRAALHERLSPYKVPRKIVFLASADALPLTPSNKINKPLLRDLLASADEAA